MKYYKVVSKTKGGLFSYAVPPSNSFRRKYKKGRWTEAVKGSFLFVFTSKVAAKPFGDHIWECEIEGKKLIKCVAYSSWLSSDDYKDFWEKGCPEEGAIRVPVGTVGAKRVKLIKEVA